MTTAQIKTTQRRVCPKGQDPDEFADGFWGPKSIAACQRHLRAMMPNPHPWPGTSQAALQRFYGSPGDTSQHTMIDVTGLGVKYQGKEVTRITCHRAVAASLLAIIYELSTFDEGKTFLALYAGVYNNRPMRGGRTPSLHSRSAAIDGDAGRNGNRTHWPTRASMPISVMEVFAKHGWLPAGAFWSRDAMHFQATR